MFDGMEKELERLPAGWRFSIGHVPHWYKRDDLPKGLRRKPFEAYIVNDATIGRKGYIFETADAATPKEALRLALDSALAKRDSIIQQERNS